MSIHSILALMADHLIEMMAVITLLALYLRFVAYKACATIQSYVKSLSRGVEKSLTKVKRDGDIDDWMKRLFENVEKELPDRGLRIASTSASKERFSEGKRGNINDFVAVKQSLSQNIVGQIDALRNSTRPNFIDLGNRVLTLDMHWQKIFRIISVETLQRVLNMLPSLFIIGGILGTFIGISSALPMIGKIDLGNLDASGPILNEFVGHIAFSMHTSIAGIVFSVIMTLLNTLFPLHVVRKDVQNIMGSIFENLWNDIHKDHISTADAKIIQLLTQMIASTSSKSHT